MAVLVADMRLATDVKVAGSSRRWSRRDYYAMAEAGILGPDERVELISGQVVDLAPIGPMHHYEVDALTELLRRACGPDTRVRCQGSVSLGDLGEPQPDIAVYAIAPEHRFCNPDATEIKLIVEVADSSLEWDCTVKKSLYAAASIPEYWIVDTRGNRLIVHRDPREGDYATVKTLAHGHTVSPLFAPSVVIQTAEFLDENPY